MANIIKAKCTCGSRARVIRTDPGDSLGILTCRCDNEDCQREFKLALSFLEETKPPVKPPEPLDQLDFMSFCSAG